MQGPRAQFAEGATRSPSSTMRWQRLATIECGRISLNQVMQLRKHRDSEASSGIRPAKNRVCSFSNASSDLNRSGAHFQRKRLCQMPGKNHSSLGHGCSLPPRILPAHHYAGRVLLQSLPANLIPSPPPPPPRTLTPDYAGPRDIQQTE